MENILTIEIKGYVLNNRGKTTTTTTTTTELVSCSGVSIQVQNMYLLQISFR